MADNYADAKAKAYKDAAINDKSFLDKGELPQFASVDAPRDEMDTARSAWDDADDAQKAAWDNLEKVANRRLNHQDVSNMFALHATGRLKLSPEMLEAFKTITDSDETWGAKEKEMFKLTGSYKESPTEMERDLQERSRAARTYKGGGQGPTLD